MCVLKQRERSELSLRLFIRNYILFLQLQSSRMLLFKLICLSELTWFAKKNIMLIHLMGVVFSTQTNLEPVGIYIPFQLNYIPRRFDYIDSNGMTVGNDLTMKE